MWESRSQTHLRIDLIATFQSLSHTGPGVNTPEGRGYRRALESLALSVGAKVGDDVPTSQVFLRLDLEDKLASLAVACAYMDAQERDGYMLALEAAATALDITPPRPQVRGNTRRTITGTARYTETAPQQLLRLHAPDPLTDARERIETRRRERDVAHSRIKGGL